LGDLLLGEGDAVGAIARYEEAFRQNPTTEAQLKLAQAYLEASWLEEARRHYQDVIRKSPYWAEGYLGLGDVLREQGEPERALEQYRQALSRASDPALQEEIGKRIVALAPEDTSVRFRLASYYRERYKYDAAIGQYEAILSLVPPDSEDAYFALVGLGDCYVSKTKYDLALEHYRRALELARTPAQRLSVYDKIVVSEEGRAGPAGTLSAEGLQALWERALLYHEQGEDEEAKADLERIYDLDPTFRADELVPLLSELGVEVQTPSQTTESPSG
jgi:tetratricopeptide (TPR) repeat protein